MDIHQKSRVKAGIKPWPLTRELRTLLVLVTLLLVTFALSRAIRADVSHEPYAPIAIPADQSLDFTLVGSRGGAFAFYSIEYPGDGRVITIDLDVAPGDPVAIRACGLNVYGPYGYWIGPARKSLTKTDRLTFRWSDHNPARWLIQVYNYLDGVPVNFHLQISGLPNPEPTPTFSPVMLPEQAITFSLASSSLLGNSGGSFHYSKLDLTPGREAILHLYYTPDNYLVSQGFGLNVYGPDGVHYAQGGHDIRFVPGVPGSYLIQVYNYIHAINITYVLTHE